MADQQVVPRPDQSEIQPPRPDPSKEPDSLPPAPDWLFENIAEASKKASRVYMVLMGFLAYCALTIIGTSDHKLFFNEPVNLPLVNVPVNLLGFFFVAPILAIAIFIYFQLYLGRIKGLQMELTTKYAPINQLQLYPWMIVIGESPDSGRIGRWQKIISSASLWWLLPIVLLLFPLWYAKLHHPNLSYVMAIIPFVGLWIIGHFWSIFYPDKHEHKRIILRFFTALALLVVVAIPLSLRGYFLTLTLKNENFSVKPEDPELAKQVRTWGEYKGVHLEGATLEYANFAKVDLSEGHFQRADLYKAILVKANLQEAILVEANLQEANMQGAFLARADLGRANLRWANLQEVQLLEADLGAADLQEADLRGADLQEASLLQANLRGADLQEANLRGADLQEANLRGTNLQEAQLFEANLRGAKLEGAKLKNVQSLTVLELCAASTLFEAALGDQHRQEVLQKCPHLLQPPKEEKPT